MTGGAGTFGRAVSFAFARAGANVVVNDLGTSPHHKADSSPAEDVVVGMRVFGLSAVASTHDVVKDSVAIVDLALKTFGSVDIIVNTVGIHPYAPFELQDARVWKRALETNVMGPTNVIGAAWPVFKKQKYGRIINCTSDGLYGMEQSTAYVASKGAIFGLTRSLAIEGAEYGIKVNACAPVAYPPMVMSAFDQLPQQQKEWFKATFTSNSNVPAILALASDKNDISGETFELGAWGVGRMFLGTARGSGPAMTMDEAMHRIKDVMGDVKGKEFAEPKAMPEFLLFKASDHVI